MLVLLNSFFNLLFKSKHYLGLVFKVSRNVNNLLSILLEFISDDANSLLDESLDVLDL